MAPPPDGNTGRGRARIPELRGERPRPPPGRGEHLGLPWDGRPWGNSIRFPSLGCQGPYRVRRCITIVRIFEGAGEAAMPSDLHWVGTWTTAPAPAEGVAFSN